MISKLTSKKLLAVVMTIAMMFSICVPLSAPATVNAASKRTKAVKAYKKYLKNKTEYSQFSLIYLDNNKVPELLAKKGDMVSILTYYNGKVKDTYYVSNLMYTANGTFDYYKKTGVIRRGGVSNGYSTVGYPKLSKGKMKRTVYAAYDMRTGKAKAYYNANDKKISKSKFKSWIKKNTKGKKVSRAKFHSNTGSGRKKYCK